jgi:hypothetical protein
MDMLFEFTASGGGALSAGNFVGHTLASKELKSARKQIRSSAGGDVKFLSYLNTFSWKSMKGNIMHE